MDRQKENISCTVSHFYGTKFEIEAGFGPIGSTENCPQTKQLVATFEGNFLMLLIIMAKEC